MLVRLRSWLRALVGRDRFEQGMSEELRFHIEACAADLMRAGVPADEARRRARMEFGSVDGVKDDCREARGLRWFDALRRDTRHAVRVMGRAPGFTLTALATIALCLGANLTIFAVVDAVLLHPLPFPQSDRLMGVYNTYPLAGVPNDGASLANYYERRGQLAAFSGLAAYSDGSAVIGEPGDTERVPATWVSPEFFETLGVAPRLGRAFTEDETSYATDDVVVLTDAFWRQRLGADLAVLGRTLRVGGTSRTIVGVLPPEFRFLSSRTLVYFPLASNPEDRAVSQRHSGNIDLIARLGEGASVAEAQAEVDAHTARLEETNPMAPAMAEAGFRSIVTPLHADHVSTVRPVLLSVQTGALCLLLIGVVNLVNLLLIRTGARAKEQAVRMAIGASRGHVVAAMLVETVMLTMAGGVLGIVVGAIGVRLLGALGAEHLPLGAEIAFSPRVAMVAIVVVLVLGVAIGLTLSWHALRHRSTNPMQFESRGNTGNRATERLRHALIVGQIAMAFILLAGAGLLGASLRHAITAAPGFRPDQVLTGSLSLTGAGFERAADLLTFGDALGAELGHQPGVTSVGLTTNVPLSGVSNKSAVTVKDYARPAGESLRGHYAYSVDGDLFDALGMTLVRGRFLTAVDSRRAERVAVVDADFARHYWPDGSAIGRQLWSGSREQANDLAFTIVGVVEPMKQAALSEAEGQGAAFFPLGHRPDRGLFVVVRTSQAAESLGPALQRVVRGIDPDLALSDVLPMTARVSNSLVARRSPAVLAGLFSAIALMLTAIGTYGVLSYAVAQRRREIGLRMALGARPEQVRGQIVLRALRLFAMGAALGLVGAWFGGRAMQSVLFGVPALHVPTLATAAVVLGIASMAASVLPSRRAARISPIEAMTND